MDIQATYKNDITTQVTECFVSVTQDELQVLAQAELGRQIGVIMRGGMKTIVAQEWHNANNGKTIPYSVLKPRVKGMAQIARGAKLNLLLDLHKSGVALTDDMIPADLLEAFKTLTSM